MARDNGDPMPQHWALPSRVISAPPITIATAELDGLGSE